MKCFKMKTAECRYCRPQELFSKTWTFLRCKWSYWLKKYGTVCFCIIHQNQCTYASMFYALCAKMKSMKRELGNHMQSLRPKLRGHMIFVMKQ